MHFKHINVITKTMDDRSVNFNSKDFSETVLRSEENLINEKLCSKSGYQSPVLKLVNKEYVCVNSPISQSSELSDGDFPSYQINQSVKSKASNKNESEINDLILPFSPMFSPVLVSQRKFRPPSSSSRTFGKKYTLEKSSRNMCIAFNFNSENAIFSKSKQTVLNGFEALRMNDKDVSWASSMATPAPEIPSNDFNTIEKATFFPDENFQKIQPRALFSPVLDENFGIAPLSFSSDSDDEKAYKNNARLSDVCATFKQLEFSSIEETSTSVKECKSLINENETCPPSPVFVIKPKKINYSKSENILNYEFSIGSEIFKSVIKEENQENSNSSNQKETSIDEEEFLNTSFTEFDKICNSLLQSNQKSKSSSKSFTSIFSIKKEKCYSFECVEPSDSKKLFYPCKTNLTIQYTDQYYNSYDDVFNGLPTSENLTKKVEKSKSNFCKNKENCDTLESVTDFKPQVLTCDKKLTEEHVSEKESTVQKNVCENETSYSENQMIHVVEVLDEEEKMLEAVEEVEKVLAVETQVFDVAPLEELKNETPEKNCGNNESAKKNKMFTKFDDKNIQKDHLTYIQQENNEIFKIPQPMHSVLENNHFIGFSTCSGKQIKISSEALLKAQTILSICEEDLDRKESLEDTSNEKLQCSIYSSKVKSQKEPYSNIDKHLSNCNSGKTEVKASIYPSTVISNDLSMFNIKNYVSSDQSLQASKDFSLGFSTCLGKKIEISKKALEKAKQLIMSCEEITDQPPDSMVNENLDSKFLNVGAGNVEKANKCLSATSEVDIFKGSNYLKTEPLTEHNENIVLKPNIEQPAYTSTLNLNFNNYLKPTCDNSEGQVFRKDLLKEKTTFSLGSRLGEKSLNTEEHPLPKSDEDLSPKLYLDTNLPSKNFSDGFGFLTASGLKVPVSEEALKKAKHIMSEYCQEETSENFRKYNSVNEISPICVVNENKNFKSERNCSSSGLEKEKFFKHTKLSSMYKPILNESNYNVSDNNSKKLTVKQEIKNDIKNENSKPEETGSTDSFFKTEFNEEEWAEIPQDWHEPLTSNKCSSEEKKACSPVFFGKRGCGSAFDKHEDQFESKSKKTKYSSQDISSPKKGVEISSALKKIEIVGEKRPSSSEESLPVKKIKSVHEDIKYEETHNKSYIVEEDRATAIFNQKKIINEKRTVKPVMGSLLLKKLSKNRSKLIDVVQHTSPKGYAEEDIGVNVLNLLDYKFSLESSGFDSTASVICVDSFKIIPNEFNKIGVEEFKMGLLAGPGVQPNLIPEGWVENHYKWIVWKLSRYEKAFPNYFAGRALTPQNVILQLKYRYDREIDRHERSALKKILEKDDVSIKRMVLNVSGIKEIKNQNSTTYELILTDGWYSCPTRVDPAMTKIIEKGKISVGTKLITQGAVLVNCEQGMSPLENFGDTYLKIFTNSTRKIRWDAKLGFQKNPGEILISLESILPEGGLISLVNVIVLRTYPLLYLEKTLNGQKVVRNRRLEEKVALEYKTRLEQKLESIYNQIHCDMAVCNSTYKKDESAFSEHNDDDLYFSMKNDYDSQGDNSSIKVLHDIQIKKQDNLKKKIFTKVEEQLKKELVNRNVTEFLQVKVTDFKKPNFTRAIVLSIWNPDEEVTNLLSEGKVLSLTNLVVKCNPSSRDSGVIKINTTRQTRFKEIRKSCEFPVRKLTALNNIPPKNPVPFNEIDLVGVIVSIKNLTTFPESPQIVYLSDLNFNFVGLYFGGGCKSYGWENVLRPQSIVGCCNLYWKGKSNTQVPVLYVSQTSVFTENPKIPLLREGIKLLKESLPKDLHDFISKGVDILKKLLGSSSNEVDMPKEVSSCEKVVTGESNNSILGNKTALTEKKDIFENSTPKQIEKIQKGGKMSHSPFRWLPYKNV